MPATRAGIGHLREIRVPTLIVVGESDIPDVHAHAGAIEAEESSTAGALVLPDSGHFVHMGQPEEFNRLVGQFLSPPVTVPPRSTLAITRVTVIDTTGGPPKSDRTVIVADGRIVAIGAVADIAPPAGAW